MSDIYAFNIIVEVKMRALVIVTKKSHPDWNDKEIENFLKSSVEYAVKKESKKR